MNAPLRPATLRADEWAASKAGLLFGFADLTLLATLDDPVWSTVQTLASFALFAVALVGFAGLGYVLNDLADEAADRRAGVVRPVVELNRHKQALLLGTLVVMAVAPWVALETSRLTVALLTVELLLLLAYPLRPLRLKERGTLALLADASYGYVIPIALTLSTFSEAGKGTLPASVVGSALVWGSAIGLRSIAEHQQGDVNNDQAAGTTTWATSRDERVVERAVRKMWSAEIVAFAVLVGCTSSVSVAIPALLGIGFWWQLSQVTALRTTDQPTRLPHDIVNPLVTYWFPITLAGALTMHHPALWPIAAAQVVIAWPWLRDLPIGGIHRTRVAMSFMVARLRGRSREQARSHAAMVATSPTHLDVSRRAVRALRRRLSS